MHRTTIQLPEALHEAVRERAKLNGLSVSEYIREAVLAIAILDMEPKRRRQLLAALQAARKTLRD